MSSPVTVGFPLYPGCTLLDFAGATQVFAYTPGFRVVWIAATLDPVSTTESVSVMPNATFDDHPPLSCRAAAATASARRCSTRRTRPG
jgi:transcriptional regulator GlxA family with amidase domain